MQSTAQLKNDLEKMSEPQLAVACLTLVDETLLLILQLTQQNKLRWPGISLCANITHYKPDACLTIKNIHIIKITRNSLDLLYLTGLQVHSVKCSRLKTVFHLVNCKLLKQTARVQQHCHRQPVNYKRRPRRPPFLRVLSDGIGVTSSTTAMHHHLQTCQAKRYRLPYRSK